MSASITLAHLSTLLSDEKTIRAAAADLYRVIDGGDSGPWDLLDPADQEFYCRGVEEVRNTFLCHIRASGFRGPTTA